MDHTGVSKDVARGLRAWQERIKAAQIPSSKLDESVNIATWNIREFGKKPGSEPAIHYIAEVLGQFDLIGVVELRDDLTPLGRVLQVLGPYWRAVYSDMIPIPAGTASASRTSTTSQPPCSMAWRPRPIPPGRSRAPSALRQLERPGNREAKQHYPRRGWQPAPIHKLPEVFVECDE